MFIKITMLSFLLTAFHFLCGSSAKPVVDSSPIDQAWWNGLSREWKEIFLVNQQFQQQGVDIFKLQQEYVNRLNIKGAANYSPMNQSLGYLQEVNRFGQGYPDFYARAVRTGHLIRKDSIDLATLGSLTTIYMVNGPGKLDPLIKFPHLTTLVLNFCGYDNQLPVNQQLLDLGPLQYLKELKVLHCSSAPLQSLQPLQDLSQLEELDCSNSRITSIDPLKKLLHLKKLSVGSNLSSAAIVSRLVNLEELHIQGCKKMPGLARLKKLKRFYFAESEMAIVQGGYRLPDIDFIKDLPALEQLDLENTSYRGNLEALYGLQQLKAIALPPVSRMEMRAFKKTKPACIILNAYKFEW